MGKVGYLQTQVKAAHFMVKDGHRVKSLKPFLIPNPSLSRSEEKTTLSLKQRSACFPTALRVKGLSHSCRTQEAGSTTIYPRLFRTCPLPKSATKQRLKAFPVKGREVAPTFLCWMFHLQGNSHWGRAEALNTSCSLFF